MARTPRSRTKSGGNGEAGDGVAPLVPEAATEAAVETSAAVPADLPAAKTPVAEPEPEPAPAVEAPQAQATPVEPPVASAPVERRDAPPPSRRLMPVVIAAAVSGALGVGAALFALPYGLRGVAPGTAQPDAGLVQRLDALEARIAGMPDQSPLEPRLAALETALVPAAPGLTPADLTPLASRIEALESRPVGIDAASVEARLAAAIEAAIAPLRQSLTQAGPDMDTLARAAIDAALAEARAAADAEAATLAAQAARLAEVEARAARQTALATLVAAADSGAPAPEALAQLGDAPAALAPLGEGLVTLGALRAAFPPAARAALAAQPQPEDASLGERVTGFLLAQTGARSLAPRDGEDVDAILSRAEAALRQGDLDDALDELAALSGEPAAEMAGWVTLARSRAAALAALSALNGG